MDTLNRIEEISNDFSGVLGGAAIGISNYKPEIKFNADEVFPIASTIKVPILVELMDKVERGRLELDSTVKLAEADKVAGTGIIKELHAGLELSVLDLATLMIVLSDNSATNMVIDLIGGANFINEKMDQLGLKSIRLNSKIEFEWITEHGAESLSVSNPQDFAILLSMIYGCEILSPASCQLIIDIMKKQQLNNMIPRYLPWTPYAEENDLHQDIEYGGKCGMLNGVRTDAGFIETPNGAYVLAIMTKNSTDPGFKPDNEGDITVGKISKAIYDYFTN